MYSNQGIFDAAKITCGHSLHDSDFNEVMKYKSKVSQEQSWNKERKKRRRKIYRFMQPFH